MQENARQLDNLNEFNVYTVFMFSAFLKMDSRDTCMYRKIQDSVRFYKMWAMRMHACSIQVDECREQC